MLGSVRVAGGGRASNVLRGSDRAATTRGAPPRWSAFRARSLRRSPARRPRSSLRSRQSQEDQSALRGAALEKLRESVGTRLNDAGLDKVARNIASSWSQSIALLVWVTLAPERKPAPESASWALTCSMWWGVLLRFTRPPHLSRRRERSLWRSGPEESMNLAGKSRESPASLPAEGLWF